VLRQIGDRDLLKQEFGNRVTGLMGPPEQSIRFT
jgi:hypothetical protein